VSEDLIRQRVEESISVKQALLADEHVAFVVALADRMTQALRDGRKVFFAGNGGSAADATHLAAELVGKFRFDRAPLPALSLSDNASSVTAIGNDYDYAQTFARQLRGLGNEGDLLVALSTSGTSPNVVAAVEAAKELGIGTAGLTGQGGGRLAELCDICLRVPADETARIQEGYMVLAHTACELVEKSLFSSP
jgi:D-sedoheptulose 7-phosphate isomerase